MIRQDCRRRQIHPINRPAELFWGFLLWIIPVILFFMALSASRFYEIWH